MKKYISLIALCMMLCMMLTGCGSKAVKEGTAYLESGDYDKAAEKFQEAVDKDRNLDEAYRGLGIAKWEQGEYEEALSAFESALENEAEKTATLYNFLGSCELRQDNPKEALNYYNLGLECDDAGEKLIQEMKYNVIVAYEQMEEWDNARSKLKDYMKDYPDDDNAAKEAEFLETQS